MLQAVVLHTSVLAQWDQNLIKVAYTFLYNISPYNFQNIFFENSICQIIKQIQQIGINKDIKTPLCLQPGCRLKAIGVGCNSF